MKEWVKSIVKKGNQELIISHERNQGRKTCIIYEVEIQVSRKGKKKMKNKSIGTKNENKVV